VMLDRIVSQPDRGTASISPDGLSLVYASVPGDRGQVSFRYRVSDTAGATGEGTVRIGVLDAQANPSPITFTDYVQVQAGADSRLRVSPLANDIDPTQGRLTLTGVRPDLPEKLVDGEDNPEYARLAERVESVTDTGVVIRAGDAPATMSFLYDVASDSGNTGRGLIVVKVVRESVPDYPVVADTALTLEDRDDFTTGVDVLAGRATWSGGDVSDLRVSLWGNPSDVRVDGRRISGDLPATRRIIPFAVTGTVGGSEVTTYAFLRVPGDDDVTLALRPNSAQRVDELSSVEFDMASLVALPRRATLEVGTEATTTGARAEARCTVSGSRVTYEAGTGSPWADACIVPVRIAGTQEWTLLSVPIGIVARDPQPELRPGSLTVGPGETATFDLRNMTSWQLGREDWNSIRYALEYSGSAFSSVTLDGSTVTVTGADRAIPGSENAAIITVTSHNAVAPARLLLRVGAAPSTLPQGGTTSRQCSQADGSSCTIEVIGADGEVNPLPRTPLEVVGVRSTGTCTGVSFAVASATSIAASWTGDAPGATCAASVTLRDAQGRSTAGPRDARVVLDLQGYPRTPASVRQSAYADGSLTLRVDAGEARRAYPGLTGFVVRYRGDIVARCAPDGGCPTVSAPNGDQREYVVTAVNDVGESRGSVRTTAWAYDPPPRPDSVDWTPTVTDDGSGNVVDLLVRGVDAAETGSLQIRSSTGETQTVSVGRNQQDVPIKGFRVGSNASTEVRVTPLSRFDVPAGLGGSVEGGVLTFRAHGVGKPTGLALTLTSRTASDGSATIMAQATADPNGTDSELRFGIVEGTNCRTGDDGARREFPGKKDGEEYTFTACVDSVYQGKTYGSAAPVTDTKRVDQDRAAPQGYTFRVDAEPILDRDGGRAIARWRIDETIQAGNKPPRNNVPKYTNFDNNRSTVFDSDPGIGVYFEHELWGTKSETGRVTPADGSAPYQVQASAYVRSCVAGDELDIVTSSSNDKAVLKVDTSNAVFRDGNGAVVPRAEGSDRVPVGAERVENVVVTVDWSAQGWGLDAATLTVSGSCSPGTPTKP
ncbi:hypothetical protein P2P98_14960, partial [Microbacterium sp. Kw_RZR3]|uniref:Ig-like domain-containing protein n=1 Tax=Microbacterium sp. Kw_RZR3 TaxID=3032903 RepID=UPI00298BA519|nr:hypothetical protein [Microbacterium sp. Kw_RZR3]